MAKPFRPKRGTTAENNAFIGLPYEVTLDTERHSLHIHDGITAGGFELMPKDLTDGRYIRTVNGQTPDINGNVEVAGGGGTGDASSEEILEAARRVADVEVDPAIAEVQALQTEVARVATILDGVVRSVNGETPDENGNVEITAGGGGSGDASREEILEAARRVAEVEVDPAVAEVRSLQTEVARVATILDGVVRSINDQTPDDDGKVNIDVGVKTVNSLTPDANGNVDISVDTGVMTVNSIAPTDGNVVIDTGVMTINGVAPTSGNVTLQTNDFISKATNPVSDIANDTTAVWKAIEGGVYYYNQNGCLTDQPSQYGVLTHIVNGNNVYQQFKGLPSGAIYYRSGTATGWSISWMKIATTDSTVSSVNGNTGAVTALQTGCVPAIGNREQPAGYVKITNTFEPLTVTNDSLDFMMMGNRSAITVPDGTFSTAWVKRVGLNQANVSITLGANWKWKGGVAPTTKAKSMLVLRWCTNFGVAEIVDETPINTGVMTVNGISPTDGDVTVDIGVKTVNGSAPDATGNVVVVNDFSTKAVNPVASVDDDTVDTWMNLESGVYRFDQLDCLNDQPGQFGFLIHIVEGNSVFQQFKAQPSGAMYYRGGNSSGWRTTWRKLAVAGANTTSSTGSDVTITASTNDYVIVTAGVAVTVSDGEASTAWTKSVALRSASATVSLGSSWKWVGGTEPAIKANSILELKWMGTFGLANLIAS